MERRRIGGDGGLDVSLVGLGCNAFGKRVDEKGTHAVIDAAIDAGIDFFDTAESYGGGESERFMGTGLKGKRDRVFLATKFGNTITHIDGKKRGSPENIRAAIDKSLRKLQTDWIDLYQLHRPDYETPIEVTIGALEDLVSEGKIRYYGCSYFTGDQMQAAVDEAKRLNAKGFVTAQNAWNILERGIEGDLIPVCEENDVTVLPYYPIAKGLLTGKYKRGQDAPEGSRLTDDADLKHADFDRLESLEAYACDHGYSLLALAMSWLAVQPVTASIIAGGSKPEQMTANAAAVSWKLTQENLREIEDLLAT